MVVALLLTVGCSADPGTDQSAPQRPASTSLPQTPEPTATLEPDCPAPSEDSRHLQGLPSAEAANTILARQALPAWEAADIGASVRMSDGRIVWVFGDTLRSGLDPLIVANSMLISSTDCVSQVMPSDRGAVIPNVSSDVVYWPMSVLAHHTKHGERLAVLCSRIRRGGSGDAYDFTFLGTSAAMFDVPPGGAPELVEVTQVTPDNPNPHQVNWGAASFHDGRWIYAYGTRLPRGDYQFGRELYVVRIPLRDPTDPSTYRFWDGRSWQPDRTRAVPVLAADGGVSQTLSVDELNGEYLAVSKRDGDLGEFVYTWTAPTPHGPWIPHAGVHAPSDFDEGNLKYAPLGHPEVPMQNGMLLVSVSRNTTDLTRLLKDPDIGVPEFVEVALRDPR